MGIPAIGQFIAETLHTSVAHRFEHHHSFDGDGYREKYDDDGNDWNHNNVNSEISNSMHFCLSPIMPHGLLTSVYVSARRLLTPFISLSNTQEGYQGRFQGDTNRTNTSCKNCAFFPV